MVKIAVRGIPWDMIDQPFGVAGLDADGKISADAMPASGLNRKGVWNASTNTPALSDSGGGGTEDDFYIVSVAGTTSLDGIDEWAVGDWVLNLGTTWTKVDNSQNAHDLGGPLHNADALTNINAKVLDNTLVGADGVAGGQTIIGGTLTGENLVLKSNIQADGDILVAATKIDMQGSATKGDIDNLRLLKFLNTNNPTLAASGIWKGGANFLEMADGLRLWGNLELKGGGTIDKITSLYVNNFGRIYMEEGDESQVVYDTTDEALDIVGDAPTRTDASKVRIWGGDTGHIIFGKNFHGTPLELIDISLEETLLTMNNSNGNTTIDFNMEGGVLAIGTVNGTPSLQIGSTGHRTTSQSALYANRNTSAAFKMDNAGTGPALELIGTTALKTTGDLDIAGNILVSGTVDGVDVSAHEARHISGGADAFLSTDLLEAIIKRIRTTTGPTDLLVGAIADGEYLKRSGTGIIGTTPPGRTLTPIITPTALTGNVNDYNPSGLSTAQVMRVEPSGAIRNITGIAAQEDGARIYLLNISGTYPIILRDQDTNSLAANRFIMKADLILEKNEGICLIYDGTTQRWRVGAANI